MPGAADILDGLSTIANQATGVAMAWHLLIAAALVALASGWRPSRRTARLLIGTPLASVAAVAIVFANPFNGMVFAASVSAMTALAMRGDRRLVLAGSAFTGGIGLAMIAFGWVYPHFMKGPPIAYLYAAPVGLVPCPTLAVVIGFALLGDGLGSRPWGLALAAVGLFYGLFGVFRLAVFLDIGLVCGAVALIAAEFGWFEERRIGTRRGAARALMAGRRYPIRSEAGGRANLSAVARFEAAKDFLRRLCL
jgi:hypothetical protein